MNTMRIRSDDILKPKKKNKRERVASKAPVNEQVRKGGLPAGLLEPAYYTAGVNHPSSLVLFISSELASIS
jgi:hypothetical protein